MQLKYSFCTTVYNSKETIDTFIKSLVKSKREYEIVVVDNYSTDGTYEKLIQYNTVRVFREKCTRGRGRQTAIEKSVNDVIVMLDADVEYVKLDEILCKFENSGEQNILWHLFLRDETGLMPIIIAEKKLFHIIGGFPNINAGEDTYLYKLTEQLNLYKRIKLPVGTFHGIPISGRISGDERRYHKHFFLAVIKRCLFTRDVLFVHEFNFSELIEFYKLSGFRGNIIGLIEYVAGKLMRFTIKDKTIDERIRVMKRDPAFNTITSVNMLQKKTKI